MTPDPASAPDDPDVPARLPPGLSADYLRQWGVVPVPSPGGTLRVLASEPPDPQVLDDLHRVYRAEPRVEHVASERLEAAVTRIRNDREETAADLIEALSAGPDPGGDGERGEADLLARAHEPPVVRLVNRLLLEALEARASDVHLEARDGGLLVRYRVDGVLSDGPSPPPHLAPAVVSRLKVMAELDVAERRRPQDGRVRLRTGRRAVDVRVSTLPTLHGESVVLRILEGGQDRLGLGDLGMGDETRSAVLRLLETPHGVLLATGPTGSGKTTTLYAALRRLHTGRQKIVTVEDPIEYGLDGVTQVPVNRKAGVTFASALRSILRQDPDVLLVGEMRDPETAEICVQAALTGHLVLSTLHTNDAPGALPRLTDLGVEPYLVASTVEGVLAQRLVRTVCPECAQETTPDEAEADAMARAGFEAERIVRGSGCDACRGTGYRGRTGIYELFVVDEEVRAEVLRRRGVGPLRELARRKGMRPLRVDGWRQVQAGITTPEEVLRVARR